MNDGNAEGFAEQTDPYAGRTAGWTGARKAAVLFGGLLSLVALALVGAGATAAYLSSHDNGYISLGTGTHTHRTGSYAMSTDGWDRTKMLGGLGRDLRVTFTPERSSAPVFIGIADEAAGRTYLDGVQYTTIHDSDDRGDVRTDHPGGAPKSLPAAAGIWAAGAGGTGPQTLKWTVPQGHFVAVAMNADGTRGVAGRVEVAAKIGWLPWLAVGLLVGGLVLLVVSLVWLIVRPVRRARGRLA